MSLQETIWKWASALPPWQGDLLRRLFTKHVLSEDELDEVRRIILAEHELPDPDKPAPAPVRVRREEIPADAAATGSVRVRALYDLENVNAVASGQRLEFEPQGITIVYGDNGAGKSGYARVLKQACRAAHESDPILPDVFGNTRPGLKGKAKFEVLQKTDVAVLDREVNTPPLSLLSTISVFDSKCAEMYADKTVAVPYIPTSLRVFERLADTQGVLRQRIQAEFDQLKNSLPVFNDLLGPTAVGEFMRNLSKSTSMVAVDKLVTLTETEQGTLAELDRRAKELEVTDPLKKAADLRRRAAEARSLAEWISQVTSTLSDDAIARYRAADELAVSTATAAVLASTEAFAREPVPGVGTPPWKVLWEAAREFSRSQAYPEQQFPVTNGEDPRCVLCLQPLSDEAKARFTRFEEFVVGTTANRAEEAAAEVTRVRDGLRALPLPSIQAAPIRQWFRDEHPALEELVSAFIGTITTRLAEVEAALAAHDWPAVVPLAANPGPALTKWAGDLEEQAGAQEALSRPEERAKIQKELAELRARNQLSARRADVERWIQDSKRMDRLQRAITALVTTSITSKQSSLTESVVTKRLKEKLLQEKEALQCGHIPIQLDTKGAKGKTLALLSLQGAEATPKVTAVLSEGEQRALSLAFFLAEIGAADHDGGIVLDDPVSSLDHVRREHVAKRLVEEAARRQVIVFTHDIVFLTDLQTKAEAGAVPCQTRTVRAIGIVHPGLPEPVQKSTDRRGYLRNELQALAKLEKQNDPDAYRRQAKQWLGLLREAWERAVEEHLFQGTVQRYQASIQTQRLKKVVVTPELTVEVERGMTAVSAWTAHDQAAAINRPPPTVDELAQELQRFSDFLDKLTKPNKN